MYFGDSKVKASGLLSGDTVNAHILATVRHLSDETSNSALYVVSSLCVYRRDFSIAPIFCKALKIEPWKVAKLADITES